ncbi:MAG: 4Fe-4S binding protein [Promethearchaeota archaeon]
MSNQDVYERLREHMDNTHPIGYPATKSGVELRLLKHVFTEEEAELACHLSPFPETVEQIAERVGRDPVEIEKLLEKMGRKGSIYRSRARGITTFRAVPLAIGFYEHQVASLTKEFAEDFEQYIEEAFRDEIITKTPQLRVVPINASITPTMKIASYEDARELIRQQNKIALAECICKKEKGLLGKECEKPTEVCFAFSSGAYYYIENNLGREVTHEEALQVLDQAEQAGLVISPGNAQKPFAMCLCCGCCCGILTNLKKMPKPSSLAATNYYAQSDPELCSGCETCLDRCQMDAITIQDDVATIDLDRCIGCGLCVTTCPEDALTLIKKEQKQVFIPPANATELYMKIGAEREQERESKSS